MANLTLERLGVRYGLADCRDLATHGRWLRTHPELMRGLKRGFTFYRHHSGVPFDGRGDDAERLLVAASPGDESSDTHWLRADVDHHFVREAVAAGVEYRDGVELTAAAIDDSGVRLGGNDRDGAPFDVHASFIIDASGPGGFAARHFAIPPALARTETRASLVFSHFAGVRRMAELVPDMPAGPYPDDWAAVHHVIDEGWMYSLRFDDGITSAGILLAPPIGEAVGGRTPDAIWRAIVDRYPTIAAAFADATPLFPLRFIPLIQHRLSTAAGERWAMLPHAYTFVDPLFSTGIAWGLRGVERLALAFEEARETTRRPSADALRHYDRLLGVEADMIDRVVATAYEAMADFPSFAAHSMIYFALVSFGEVRQRLRPDETWAWSPFLDAGDPLAESIVAESREHARAIGRVARANAGRSSDPALVGMRQEYLDWVVGAIAPRNVAGLADPARRNRYPVDVDLLIEHHDLLGMTRDEVIDKLPLLRGA